LVLEIILVKQDDIGQQKVFKFSSTFVH